MNPGDFIKTLTLTFIAGDFGIHDVNHPSWDRSGRVIIDTYWNTKTATASRQFAVQALWSRECLYVRFETVRIEELNVNSEPRTDWKTIGLWERDVCEIFIAPDKNDSQKYFEFEVAPTGEWLDLAIDLTSGERITDWDYRSGMESAACIEQDRVLMAIKIPWEAFGCTPKAGDVWLGNLFRCVGKEPHRDYLAWCPTLTEVPNFHVPERFGQLIFDN